MRIINPPAGIIRELDEPAVAGSLFVATTAGADWIA
jgi:hypothetical protein